MDLCSSNLFYRAPVLYDLVQDDPGNTTARLCEELIDTYAPARAQTLLDFGCGTGRDLEYLAARFDCTGVDLQPQMVAYARQARPMLHIVTGDMRSFRLGHEVDAITCLGNSIAYLHEDQDIKAAFTTFAAHAHPGTVLILMTTIAPIEQPNPRSRLVDVDGLRGQVTIHYEWDVHNRINTMHRHWILDDGTEERDTILRRVLTPQELDLLMSSAGFEFVEMFSNPKARDQGAPGPSAYLVARSAC